MRVSTYVPVHVGSALTLCAATRRHLWSSSAWAVRVLFLLAVAFGDADETMSEGNAEGCADARFIIC